MFDHNSERLLDIAIHAMLAEQYETAGTILDTVVTTSSSAMSVSWAYSCLSALGHQDAMQSCLDLKEAAVEEEKRTFPGFNWTTLRLYHKEFPEITNVVTAGIGYEQAKIEFQERVRRDPNNHDAIVGLAYCLCRTQKEEEGISVLAQVIEAESSNHRALGIRGDRYRRTGRLGLANEDLKRAIRLDPNSPTVNLQLGTLQKRMEQYVPAIESLSKAVTNAPDFAEPHTERALLWNKMNLPFLEIYDQHCVSRIRTEIAGYQIPDSHWPQACQEAEGYIAAIASGSPR